MTEELLQRIAEVASTLESVVAVGLIGSQTRGWSEKADDWDFVGILKSNDMPPEKERRRLWMSPESPVSGAEFYWGACNDRFVLNGVDIGIDYHLSIPSIEESLTRIIERGKRLPILKEDNQNEQRCISNTRS